MDAAARVALYRRLPVVASDTWWTELAGASLDGRVLELGAGAGRLTSAFLDAGAAVVAVERDAAMAAALRARVGGRAQVVEADATHLPPAEPCGLVALPSALLNEVDGPAARLAVLRSAAASCRAGGLVALHLLGPWWLTHLPPRSGGRLRPVDGSAAIDVTIEAGPFDAVTGRRQASLVYGFPDGVVLRDELDAAVVTPGELSLLFEVAGLEPVAWYGATPPDGGPDGGQPAWHVLARPRRTGAA